MANADDAEFEAQVRTCLPALKSRAMRLTRRGADADDLVQDTLILARRSWSRFDRRANVAPWLFAIMRNTFISQYRRRTGEQMIFKHHAEEVVELAHGDGPEEPHERIESELSPLVAKALASLPQKYREVIEHADLRGETYIEVATALGIPLGTVMSRLHRGRRILEPLLAAYAREAYEIERRPEPVLEVAPEPEPEPEPVLEVAPVIEVAPAPDVTPVLASGPVLETGRANYDGVVALPPRRLEPGFAAGVKLEIHRAVAWWHPPLDVSTARPHTPEPTPVASDLEEFRVFMQRAVFDAIEGEQFPYTDTGLELLTRIMNEVTLVT